MVLVDKNDLYWPYYVYVCACCEPGEAGLNVLKIGGCPAMLGNAVGEHGRHERAGGKLMTSCGTSAQ